MHTTLSLTLKVVNSLHTFGIKVTIHMPISLLKTTRIIYILVTKVKLLSCIVRLNWVISSFQINQ